MNDLNPSFIRDLFELRETRWSKCEAYEMILNEVMYGTKSLRTYGSKIWYTLPFHIKPAEYLQLFKKIIKNIGKVLCLYNMSEIKRIFIISISLHYHEILFLLACSFCS